MRYSHILVLVLLLVVLQGCAYRYVDHSAADYNRFGAMCIKNKLYTAALFWLHKALDVDPDYYPAYNNMAVCYEAMDENDKAKDLYEKAYLLSKDKQVKNNLDLFTAGEEQDD